MAANTSVDDWLRSLGLLSYSEAFIDNGYDDLDICKQIGDEDLDAIGVINSKDRRDILQSVRLLKDKGVNAVYFQLESDETANPKVGQCDREKYRREDLIQKMKDLLSEDNCVLPENNSTFNEHDPLDDLAQYYADQLYTYFPDVKEVLEYLRDGESNEGLNSAHSSPKTPKKKHLNSKLAEDSRLSKSLNSLDSAMVKGKAPKSPKHGIGRLFSGKKKNYVYQPPKISGPMETAILASQVKMSDDDRKSLMLQVKHGDMTQEEALNNFLSYEANHTDFSKEQDKSGDNKQGKKKRGGFFNRSSFKRHSSGHSSEVLASNITIGEKDRMELMRKIKTGEITTEEAWESLRRFGAKRDSKNKSPKLRSKGSKSTKTKDRISASSVHLSSTFYTGVNSDISQSTSNIPSRTGSTDSSPDSTPGLPRKLDLQQGYSTSAEQLRCSDSFESMDVKGNYSTPKPPVPPKRSPSPLTHDIRRTVSAKGSSLPRDISEAKRRSTMTSVSDTEMNRCSNSSERLSQNLNKDRDSTGSNAGDTGPPVPARKPPKLPPNKPVVAAAQCKPAETKQHVSKDNKESNTVNTHNGHDPHKKPKIPDRPALPSKPSALRPRPPAKPHNLQHTEKPTSPKQRMSTSEDNKDFPDKLDDFAAILNGTVFENHNDIETKSKGEPTSDEKIEKGKPRIPPRRPSPLTRVSRQKTLGPKLLEIIEAKLQEEGIDLVQEPYTVKDGEWGVPMTLVDRYAGELQTTMREITNRMDHIRIEKLRQTNKPAIPCDLPHQRFTVDVIGKLTSMPDWLTSLGLPMYIDSLMAAGYDDIHEVPYLSEEHLEYANITNPEHKSRIIRSLENMPSTYERQPIASDDID